MRKLKNQQIIKTYPFASIGWINLAKDRDQFWALVCKEIKFLGYN
jgi:hypothetical protein